MATDYSKLIDKETWAFIERTNSYYPPDTVDYTIGQQRAIYDRMCREFFAGYPEGVTAETSAIAEEDHDIPIRTYRNKTPDDAALVLYYHGGGFILGGLESHDDVCAELCKRTGYEVVSVDYRLAPEAPWPAAPDDCEAAARWVAESPAALGRSVTSLVLCGDSAGGNLAIVTAMALRDAPAKVPAIAQIPFYPAADMSQPYPSYEEFADGYLLTRDGMDWFGAAYAAETEHVRTSPLKGDLAGLPPALVVTASLDPIRDQGRAYAAALARAGVPVIFREAKGQIHGFITIRKAIPSSVGDVSAALAAAKDVIAEAEGERVMAQAAAA